MYLLIGTVLGAALGFVGVIITTLINRRTQLKLAREAHQQQYEMEALKTQAQAEHEAQLYLGSKIEEAHQILSKIAMENSQEACHIMLDQGVTEAEYHTRYLQQQVELRRLEMLVALYFPKLREQTKDLRGLTSQFWGKQKFLITHNEGWETIRTLPLGEALKQEPHATLGELRELVDKIGECVWRAKNQLQALVYDAIPSSFK